MKRILLLLSILGFPLYAFGDYVPGRTRASAEAELGKLRGDGRYQDVSGAHALQLETDGKGVTGFQVSLDRRPEIPFKLSKTEPTRCGRRFQAELRDGTRTHALTIDEFANDGCRRGDKVRWNVTLTTDEGAGATSHLELDGDAEYFLLTQ